MNPLDLITEQNIAKHLDEDKLKEIAQWVHAGYLVDKQSRESWERKVEEWTKEAMLYAEEKTFPWPGASNVKYPLVATACMQFSARAYPSLVPSDGKVVKGTVIGSDPDGNKSKRASRIAKHMSYQIMEEMPGWEEDMDRLLYVTSILGTAFKKTYFDAVEGTNVSKLVMPQELVVNYWAKSLEEAERKTQIMYVSKRTLKERQNKGIYLDVDLPAPSTANKEQPKKVMGGQPQPQSYDDMVPYTILEQHGFWDLDDDGYPEPYIFTIEESSKTLLRITARFSQEDVEADEKGKILKITPIEYYTKFPFVPNPDGGFYDVGFGLFLGPLNAAVDSLINQLVDAGTISNLQAGFIAKGLKIKMGDQQWKPGEWKAVAATADDLRKQIVPLPAKDPSPVLFQLLGMLVESGMKLASVAEIFVGKMPGQNTPAYTTKETVEQGMKVFTAIYKRIYRALKLEFRKLYLLNHYYMDVQTIQNVLDEPVDPNDYDLESVDVVPAADPNASSQTDKMAKFQHALQLMGLGTLDPMAMTMRGLEAGEIPNPEQLIRKGPPPPNPEQQKMQMEMQMKQAESQMKIQIAQLQAQIKAAEGQQKLELERQLGDLKLKLEMMKANIQAQVEQGKMAQQQQQHQLGMRQQVEQTQVDIATEKARSKAGLDQQNEVHQTKMKQSEESHKQKLTQQKQAQRNKPQPKGKK